MFFIFVPEVLGGLKIIHESTSKWDDGREKPPAV
jgi:hypothetical protein